MPDNTPFFIIGAGRSGTTLLRLILAGHSRLYVTPETWFIGPLVHDLPLTAKLDEAQVERAVELIVADYRWPDMEMTVESLRSKARQIAQPSLVDVINIVYAEQLARAGKSRCGDKTPIYIEIVPQLIALYPGARFIHLIRDGRDVSISRIDAGWERYYEASRFTWTQTMRWRERYANASFSHQILEVKYENLVTDPEPTVRQICRFLDEDFEPGMLDWRQLVELVPERERTIHRRLAQPLSDDAVGIWRTRLTALECFAMESCIHADLEQLGYRLRYRSPAWRLLLNLAGRTLRALAPLLSRGIPYLQRHHILPRRLYI
jgi:hypothetical protein